MSWLKRLALVLVITSSTSLNADSTNTGSTSDTRSPFVLAGTDIQTLKPHKLEFPSKNPMVLIFLSSKCPCSISHIPELQALAKEYPDVNFFGINSNSDESLETAQKYFLSVNLGFPVLRDDGQKIADFYRASKTPHAYLLNREGKVLFQGGVSDSSKFPQASRKFLRESLEDIKSGSTVRTPIARALGCAITR